MTKDELRAAYPIGRPVVATALFREQFATWGRGLTATVVGYGRNDDTIRVRREGQTTVQTYHRHFWDRIV